MTSSGVRSHCQSYSTSGTGNGTLALSWSTTGATCHASWNGNNDYWGYTAYCVGEPEEPCPSSGTQLSSGDLTGVTGGCVTESTKTCAVTLQPGVAIEFPSNPGVVWGRYTYTGAECSAGTGAVAQAATDGCAVSAAGVTVCQSQPNCGTVNGAEVCADAAPSPGTCTITANGTTFCVAPSFGASPSSPPAPDNGTAGQPATADASLTGDSNGDGTGDTQIFGYTSGTTAGSTTTTGDQNQDGEGSCGAPGQPKCSVDIDESGMPAVPTFQEWDDSAALNAVENAAAENPSSGWDLPALLPVIPSGACQSMTVTYFGRDLTIPGVKGCEWIESLKEVLAFCLFFVTLLNIGTSVIRSI